MVGKPKTVKETLAAALKLITSKSHWIQGDYRKKKRSGMAYCAIGALEKVDGPYEQKAKMLLEDLCFTLYTSKSVEVFNDRDSTKHQDVLDLYRRAIQRAK